jgi:hypothetical protein
LQPGHLKGPTLENTWHKETETRLEAILAAAVQPVAGAGKIGKKSPALSKWTGTIR